MASTNPNNAQPMKKLALAGDLLSVARVPGSDRIFVGGYDGKIHLIDLSADKPQPTSWAGHLSYVSGLVLTEKHLVSAGSDRKIVWWDAATHQAVRTVETAHAKWIRQLAPGAGWQDASPSARRRYGHCAPVVGGGHGQGRP